MISTARAAENGADLAMTRARDSPSTSSMTMNGGSPASKASTLTTLGCERGDAVAVRFHSEASEGALIHVVEHLHRDALARLRHRFVDAGHTAAADLADDAIASAEHLTDEAHSRDATADGRRTSGSKADCSPNAFAWCSRDRGARRRRSD